MKLSNLVPMVKSWFRGKVAAQTKGVELIDAVTNRFSDMISELDQGIADCNDEHGGIDNTIKQLIQRNAILESSAKKAVTIISNLRKLIGE